MRNASRNNWLESKTEITLTPKRQPLIRAALIFYVKCGIIKGYTLYIKREGYYETGKNYDPHSDYFAPNSFGGAFHDLPGKRRKNDGGSLGDFRGSSN